MHPRLRSRTSTKVTQFETYGTWDGGLRSRRRAEWRVLRGRGGGAGVYLLPGESISVYTVYVSTSVEPWQISWNHRFRSQPPPSLPLSYSDQWAAITMETLCLWNNRRNKYLECKQWGAVCVCGCVCADRIRRYRANCTHHHAQPKSTVWNKDNKSIHKCKKKTSGKQQTRL